MKFHSQLVYPLILVCIFAFVLAEYPQTKKEITENEYLQAMRTASDAEDKVPYRATSVEETYKNGQLVGTSKGMREQTSANMYRYIYEYKYKGNLHTRETIQIGNYYYCREDSKQWKKTTEFCGMMYMRRDPIRKVVHFSVDETKLNGQAVKLYAKTSVMDDFDGVQRFSEEKSWINSSGHIVREENTEGLGNGKEIISKEVKTFDYNPVGLKIEAPIK